MENKFMLLAIKEAKKALIMGEVPIGAVIVKDGKVIAKAYNKKEKLNSATRHAEIIAVEKASRKLNNWRLNDCDIYVTLEPCPMCASALKQSRISNLYYGLSSKDIESRNITNSIYNNDFCNPIINVSCGYFSSEIEEVMNLFFKEKRAKK